MDCLSDVLVRRMDRREGRSIMGKGSGGGTSALNEVIVMSWSAGAQIRERNSTDATLPFKSKWSVFRLGRSKPWRLDGGSREGCCELILSRRSFGVLSITRLIRSQTAPAEAWRSSNLVISRSCIVGHDAKLRQAGLLVISCSSLGASTDGCSRDRKPSLDEASIMKNFADAKAGRCVGNSGVIRAQSAAPTITFKLRILSLPIFTAFFQTSTWRRGIFGLSLRRCTSSLVFLALSSHRATFSEGNHR